MGVDAGDYDNDGDFDLFVTNFANDYSTMYTNQGKYFDDITPATGLYKPTYATLGWGTSFSTMTTMGISTCSLPTVTYTRSSMR